MSKLALIYTEPVTDEKTANTDDINSAEGFQMEFSAKILPVKVNTASIPPLLKKAKKILDLDSPPNGLTGCKDCERLEGIVELMVDLNLRASTGSKGSNEHLKVREIKGE